MRIKKNIAAKDGAGNIRITAEVAEDMWHVYNIVQPGDEIKAGTTRKVRPQASTSLHIQLLC
jgi:protein pelota